MANSKVSALTADTSPTIDDLIHVVNDPAGTPADRKVALGDLPFERTLRAFNRQTGSYTLVLGDAIKIIELNVASANNLTVPPNSSVAFPVGTRIPGYQYGAGATTIVQGSGVTVRSSGGALIVPARYGRFELVKVGTDEWYLDLAAQPATLLAQATGTSAFAPTTTKADLSAASISFDVVSRPVVVTGYMPFSGHGTAGTTVNLHIADGSNVDKDTNGMAFGANQYLTILVHEYISAAGSYTRKLRGVSSAGTGFMNLASLGTWYIRAVEV